MPYFDDFCRSRCLLTFFNKSVEFSEKYQRGGVIFNLKKYVADFGNFKQGFLTMKLIQRVASLKNLQCNFPKMRGGGSKAVWNFSENSADL